MFNKLFAVCLLVENFETSLTFYRDTLGLKIEFENDKFASFQMDGTSLSIFQKKEATAMVPASYMKSGGGMVLGFKVDDITQACEKLESKGVKIFEGPKNTPWGQKVAYFNDPDGNIWEVSEPFVEK